MKSLPLASASHDPCFGLTSSCLANGRTGEKWEKKTEKTEVCNHLCCVSVARYWLTETSRISMICQQFCSSCWLLTAKPRIGTQICCCAINGPHLKWWLEYRQIDFTMWGRKRREICGSEGGVGLYMQTLPWRVLIHLLKLLLMKLPLCVCVL